VTALTQLQTAALLDAMPDATAILSRDATIVAVNRAWRNFAIDNGGSPEDTGVGINYLDVCNRAAAAGCSDAGAAAAGLNAVLSGDSVECDFEYQCPSAAVGRWFVSRITQIDGAKAGVLVSHVNISRRKKAEQKLERQASEDPLTGLVNRMLFGQRLSSALIPGFEKSLRPDVGVCFMDIAGIKQVNDRFGHAAGDDVLQSVAVRLRALARPQDTVGRIGGDEFAMLVPQIDAGSLTGVRERISAAMRELYSIGGIEFEVGASVGVYLATRGQPAAEALRRADEARYAIDATALARF
jgi:diguanylate cyclase (GGDEF)-like protein